MAGDHKPNAYPRARLPSRRPLLTVPALVLALAGASACGHETTNGDAGDGGGVCPGGGCALTCDPTDTWEVLRASSAGVANLVHVGDADPASPEEVGDGLYHLFVGVKTTPMGDPEPQGRVFEATSTTAGGTYVMSPTPLVDTVDDYDLWGIETPSYLRADEHTEYIYYCGIYQSYSDSPRAWLAALKRVDGGSWTKLGRVAPELPGGTSQCEPDVVRDPATGKFVMILQEGSEDADGQHFGLTMRISDNPELFPVEGYVRLLWDDGFQMAAFADLGPKYPKRPSMAWDPYARVWRFAWDLSYRYANHNVQTWARSVIPAREEIEAHGATLHEGNHDYHPEIHLQMPTEDSPGYVASPTSPLFPDPDTVLFFYNGMGVSGELRLEAQRCRRGP